MAYGNHLLYKYDYDFLLIFSNLSIDKKYRINRGLLPFHPISSRSFIPCHLDIMENDYIYKPNKYYLSMRQRRTNKQLQEEIFASLRRVSKRTGLSSVTLAQVATEAHMDLKVVKRRYPTESDLLEAYAAQIDVTVSDFFRETSSMSKVERYRMIFQDYITWIISNEDLQNLLVWEIADTTDKGFQSSQKRDKHIVRLLEEDFAPLQKGTRREHLRYKIILYLAGITYLSMYRDGQNFMGIDHKTKESLEEIDLILTRLLEAYFDGIS